MVEVADGITIVEDAMLFGDDVSSVFVEFGAAADDTAGVDCEELLVVIDVLEALDDVVEVVGIDVGLVVVGDADEVVVELVVSSLSAKVVWNAMTGGAVVS